MNIKPLDILHKYYGYTSFRKGQENIITSIINKEDVLAIMPTGGGKSICYQVPALCLDGITIVISPLISLMKDQVDALKTMGVKARLINSSLSNSEYNEALEEIENDTDVIIGAAGKAAHLPGVIASHTLIPVVGLPIKSSTMDGLDSLLSIVQMPPGIPVATVTIDSGINAALMALQIMSIKYPKVKEDLVLYRKEMEEKVLEDDKNLRG